MMYASELAGFFAADAIWSLSEGSGLTPMFAYSEIKGERKLDRLAFDDVAAAVEQGRQKLYANEMETDDAVLIYDGRIALDDGKVDAVILELRSYFTPRSKGTIAVPYSGDSPESFRVHKPKLLVWEGCEDFPPDTAMVAFFEGVALHEQGSAIWNERLDESR